MNGKAISGITLTLLLISILTLAFNIQPVEASGTIYIRADGSVDPPDAPISSVDNVTYALTADVNESIAVERDNIVVDGAGYTVRSGTLSGRGIDLSGRNNVTIKNMEIKSFSRGIYLNESSTNTLSGNNIVGNMIDGILLWDSSNNIISGNNITKNCWGIHLWHSSNNVITGNRITAANKSELLGSGIILGEFSSNNVIYGNNIASTLMIGVYLYSSSNNNTISRNNITKNMYWGILLSECSNNSVYGNYITANKDYGIAIAMSPNNFVYHNNFVNNKNQVWTFSIGVDVWDISYPSGGNYWSDYTGIDLYGGFYQNETGSDGIGDSPYIINEENKDNYPLMGMFSDFNATSEYHIQTICNSTISDSQFNGTAISFNVSGEDGTLGFCRICIPVALMNATYKVFVNGTVVPHILLPCSNSTHSYLYFTYNHSTQEVVIIPEFPPVLILPLLMIFTLVAVVLHACRNFHNGVIRDH